MKKTQVALAALALVASSAAMAQVTLYGNLEAFVVNQNKGGSTNFAGSGEWGASAFGIKGSEDLGGGLKAGFNLESGISLNNGTNDNGGTSGLFNRAANVSIGGESTGTLTAGLQISPFILSYVTTLGLAGNNFLVPALINAGAADNGGTAQGATGGFFIPNAVSYAVSLGGVNVSAISATKNGNDTNQYFGANVSTTINGVYLTAGYADRTDTYRNVTVGGTYTMGPLKLAANYIDSNGLGILSSDRRTATLGASYALTAATTVGFNHATTNVAGSSVDPTITNISLQHALSKRTSLYAYYNKGSDSSLVSYTAGASGNKLTSSPLPTSAIAIGVAHSF